MTETDKSTQSGISRRTLAKGTAWAVPAVAAAAAAPVHAASPVNYPGINGWVNVSYSGSWWTSCRHQLDITSNVRGNGPDGNPYGLYIYDIEQPGVTTATNAQMIWWVRGDTNVTWTNLSGHSTCWTGPVRGAVQTKDDGQQYTPYTWTYECPINTSNPDQNGRVFLNNFVVRGVFTLASGICNMVCYWAERKITIDPDGPGGSAPPEVKRFERKRGFRDCSNQTENRAAPQLQKLDAEMQELEQRKSELEELLKEDAQADSVQEEDVANVQAELDDVDSRLADLRKKQESKEEFAPTPSETGSA